MKKIVFQLKKRDKVYLFTKNPKIRKKVKNLTILRLKYFSLKLEKELLAINSYCLKILKYILYSIYYY